MAHMYSPCSWRTLQGETVRSAQGTPRAAALPSFFWEESLLPTPAGSSGVSADIATVPRRRGGVTWKHHDWNLSNSLDLGFLLQSKAAFFWRVSHPVTHFSVSSTAVGTRDLQPPEDEVLAGPMGLTEHDETGARGHSLQRKAHPTKRTSGRGWLFFFKPLYYQFCKIKLFPSFKMYHMCIHMYIWELVFSIVAVLPPAKTFTVYYWTVFILWLWPFSRQMQNDMPW